MENDRLPAPGRELAAGLVHRPGANDLSGRWGGLASPSHRRPSRAPGRMPAHTAYLLRIFAADACSGTGLG
jgi:hypothetical protein